jgi:hypothetical protein
VHPSTHISRLLRRSLWLDNLAVTTHWSCPQAPGWMDQRGDIFPETGGGRYGASEKTSSLTAGCCMAAAWLLQGCIILMRKAVEDL